MSITVGDRHPSYMFEYANLDWISTSVDAIVVQNKWYTPLATTGPVKAWYIRFEQTNNGATAEDLEMELIIDGNTHAIASGAQASGVRNYVYHEEGTMVWSIGVNVRGPLSVDNDQAGPLETRSLSLRVRQTSVVDAVAANIECNMIYATLEAL